jgi:hypothetical protein
VFCSKDQADKYEICKDNPDLLGCEDYSEVPEFCDKNNPDTATVREDGQVVGYSWCNPDTERETVFPTAEAVLKNAVGCAPSTDITCVKQKLEDQAKAAVQKSGYADFDWTFLIKNLKIDTSYDPTETVVLLTEYERSSAHRSVKIDQGPPVCFCTSVNNKAGYTNCPTTNDVDQKKAGSCYYTNCRYSFTFTNRGSLQEKDLKYTIAMTQLDSEKSQVKLLDGTITLNPGESRTVAFTLTHEGSVPGANSIDASVIGIGSPKPGNCQ